MSHPVRRVRHGQRRDPGRFLGLATVLATGLAVALGACGAPRTPPTPIVSSAPPDAFTEAAVTQVPDAAAEAESFAVSDGGLDSLPATSASSTPEPPPKLAVVKDCVIPGPPKDGSWEEALDVEWGPIMGQSVALDIAWPTPKAKRPLVIMIHGGGWTAGDKKMFRDAIRMLTGQGYAAATVNYRLANKTKNVFPAAVEDVRCAVRWLRAHAADYGIDVAHIGAVGASAGGHLAAMLATASDHIGFDATCPIKGQPPTVRAAVAYYAPLDLRDAAKRYVPLMQLAVEEFLGARSEKAPSVAALASPITHVDAHDAPILLLHAVDDAIVTVDDSRSFKKALDAAVVPNLYVELPEGRHGFPPFSKGQKTRAATCTTLAFLRETLRP